MTGDERERGGDVSAVLLVIGAAQTAGLDAEPRGVGGDVGEVERTMLERVRSGEHERFG